MMLEEGLERIGTIAKSDTHKFFQLLTGDQKKDTNLIGQFIVGFYSSFVVTDKAMLTTGRAGMTAENGAYEESDGHSSYTLENVELPRRGTEVTLHLPEGEDELLNGSRLRSIIQTYSYHITIPILTQSEDEEKKDEEDRVNQALTLWDRSKSENSVEGHNEFYKHITHDFEVPLAHGHSCVEGNYEYTLLLYISTRVTFGLWSLEWHHGVKLYVRRVFVMDDAEKLMPNYLRFLRGVIDSSGTTSLACLVIGEYDIDPHLQRLLKSVSQATPNTKPILAIKPTHLTCAKTQRGAIWATFQRLSFCAIRPTRFKRAGKQLEYPVCFVNRVSDLLA